MNYFYIFDEITEIMDKDYSGCEIKRGWSNPEHYRKLIKQTHEDGKLDRNTFKEIIDDYILDFKDSHVFLIDCKLTSNPVSSGFKVRRYEDTLYVISADQEKNLEKGMAIVKLDNMSIKEAAKKFERMLMEQPNERQFWHNIIKKCKTVTIEDNGVMRQIEINTYPVKDVESKYEYKPIDQDTVLLSYNDFQNYDLSQKLLTKYEKEIKAAKNLIIDLRVNSGGFCTVFYKLLDYIFPENFRIHDEYCNLTNVTERNYNNRMELLRGYIEKYPNDEDVKRYANELSANRNKGFVAFDIDNTDYVVKGSKEPKKVIVLTDRYCGSSGDSFVIMASQSPWVTVMGRATYGVIDYSNVAEQRFEDDFILNYPTSVYEGVKYGKGYDNVGVKPDIYIPWSPEHIEKDVDLEKALRFLRNKGNVE